MAEASAFEPEVPEPKAETYTVTAEVNILGHEPGSSFEALLDPGQKEFLLGGGFLKLGAKPKQGKAKTPEPPAEATEPTE